MQHQEKTLPGAAPPHRWKRGLSFGIAALACPCHLPIVVGLLAGTTLGGWMYQHMFIVTLAMLGIFVLALLYGLRSFNRWQVATPDHREPEHSEMVAQSAREP